MDTSNIRRFDTAVKCTVVGLIAALAGYGGGKLLERHARTDFNQNAVPGGTADPGLTSKGNALELAEPN